MIAKRDETLPVSADVRGARRAAGGPDGATITRCVTFERDALTDLQELAWAQNVPLDALVREAVDTYRRACPP